MGTEPRTQTCEINLNCSVVMNGEGREGGLRLRRWKEDDWHPPCYDNCYIDISEVALCGHPGVSDAEWGDDGEDNVPSVLPLLSNTMSAKASYLHSLW